MAEACPRLRCVEHRYGIRDFARAEVDAVRFADSGKDVAFFYTSQQNAMRQALGAIDRPGGFGHYSGLRPLVQSTIQTLAALRSPFADFLEGGEEIIALHQRHAADLDAHIQQMESLLEDLLCDALIALHRISPDRTVSRGDLLTHNFDPSKRPVRAVNPDDDW